MAGAGFCQQLLSCCFSFSWTTIGLLFLGEVSPGERYFSSRSLSTMYVPTSSIFHCWSTALSTQSLDQLHSLASLDGVQLHLCRTVFQCGRALCGLCTMILWTLGQGYVHPLHLFGRWRLPLFRTHTGVHPVSFPLSSVRRESWIPFARSDKSSLNKFNGHIFSCSCDFIFPFAS